VTDHSDLQSKRRTQPALAYVKYQDHVLYHRCNPQALAPQVRETVGWLVYDAPTYVIISWDRGSHPPRLRNSDLQESGLVILKNTILEMKEVSSHS